jgi:hypothetical protein
MKVSDIHNWVNNNSTLVTVATILILLGALTSIILQSRESNYAPPVVEAYFYDLSAEGTDPLNKLFTGPSNQFPPVLSPTDKALGHTKPTGASAAVFACGDCSDKSRYFIGYLEIYTEDAKEGIKQMLPLRIEAGHLLATVDNEKNWVNFTTPEARKIRQSPKERCAETNEEAMACSPPSDGK